jgi:hypothetical protein
VNDKVVFCDLIKKVRDMSGLLPSFIVVIAKDWIFDEIHESYSTGGLRDSCDAGDLAPVVEFEEIYADFYSRTRGCEIAKINWSIAATPIYFVARAAVNACLEEVRIAADKKAKNEDVSIIAKRIVRLSRFTQICVQMALGLSDAEAKVRKADYRRLADLAKEADSLVLVGESYLSGRLVG